MKEIAPNLFHYLCIQACFCSQAAYAISSTEHFLDSLLHHKSLLNSSPFLDVNDQKGLESAYYIFHRELRNTG